MRHPSVDVSGVGELNVDLILSGLPQTLELEREQIASGLTLTLGSSSAIFAHNLSTLGTRVGFSSCIGDDGFGDLCLRRLREAHVDVSGVRRLLGQTTGLTVILPRDNGRHILTYPGTIYEMSYDHLDLAYVLNAKHLHVSSYYLQKRLRPGLPRLFRDAKEAGLSTSLDTNDDPDNLWADDLNAVLPFVDVFLPNEAELYKIAKVDSFDAAMNKLSSLVPILAVKRGAKGCAAWRGEEKISAAALKTTVVDSVGAGDSFDAGFIHQFIRGASLENCLRFANIAGALSVQRRGGTEAFRDSALREQFLSEHSVAWKDQPASDSPHSSDSVR